MGNAVDGGEICYNELKFQSIFAPFRPIFDIQSIL